MGNNRCTTEFKTEAVKQVVEDEHGAVEVAKNPSDRMCQF